MVLTLSLSASIPVHSSQLPILSSLINQQWLIEIVFSEQATAAHHSSHSQAQLFWVFNHCHYLLLTAQLFPDGDSKQVQLMSKQQQPIIQVIHGPLLLGLPPASSLIISHIPLAHIPFYSLTVTGVSGVQLLAESDLC